MRAMLSSIRILFVIRTLNSAIRNFLSQPAKTRSDSAELISVARGRRGEPQRGDDFVQGGDAARGVGMIARRLGRALAALLAESLEEVRHVARVVAGGGHHARTLGVGLSLSRAVELYEDHVRAVARDCFCDRADSAAATARQSVEDAQSRLRHVSLRRLIRPVPERDVRYLVREHARQLALVSRRLNRARV